MQNSQIEWTDHTFNPWHGCFKVSDGCKHCYAETLSKRFGRDIWGPPATTPRRMMSENYWKQPLKWNAAAAQAGARARVFCASMADVFEHHPQVHEARNALYTMIRATPSLDWLLLTKRPENIAEMLPESWLDMHMPPNVWFGTSVESQEQADKRIPELLKVPAKVRFLSCEPLLGPVYLKLDYGVAEQPLGIVRKDMLHWVIVGGESGHGARPMHPDWARSLRDQCHGAGVAFHFKQWGAWRPIDHMSVDEHDALYHSIPDDQPMAQARCKVATHAIQFDGGAGYQSFNGHCGYLTFNVGKHAAGRLLDGVEHNELPQ